MPTDTQVNNLVINKLTKQQYESIQNPSDTELYLVPDEIDSTPTSGSDNPVTSDGIYTALQEKIDKNQGSANAGKSLVVGNDGRVSPNVAPLSQKTVSIPFGQVDSTSTSTVFTATVDGITELRDGVCCYLKNGVVTSYTGCTLNINNLGAKPMYYTTAVANRVTTHFDIAYTWLFVYNGSRVSGGCWDCYWGYDTDTNTIGYQIRTNNSVLPAKYDTYRYRLLFTSADGKFFVAANADTALTENSIKHPTTEKIDPFGKIIYWSGTTVLANVDFQVGGMWQQYLFYIGYSFNDANAYPVLTYPSPLYIKCSPQSDGSAIIDANEPYVYSLPNTEDGKIYIFLGITYSARQVELNLEHPVYYYKDGAIREWTNAAETALYQSVSYTQLLELKSNSRLVAGCRYKITDYKCTANYHVSDAYWNTRNGGLFVTALSANTLSEDGELVLLADNVSVEVATGVNVTIPYKKQVCSVKYTTDNIGDLSNVSEITVVDTTTLFDTSAPQDLIELSTPPTFTYVRDTVYDEISIYSFEINGTTYYINGNSIASTDGSTLFSTGYSSEIGGIYLSSNSEFSGILVRDNGTYYYTMTGPTVYNTGETAEINGYTFEIFSESLPYAAGDNCYLIRGYYFGTPEDGVCNYGHYDTANNIWVYSGISVTQKMLRGDEEHTEYAGKGSIYHMVDDNGNEADFDFKCRLTSSESFYLGTTLYTYDGNDYTSLEVKVDRSSTTGANGDFVPFKDNRLAVDCYMVLDLYDVWNTADEYFDFSYVDGCVFKGTSGSLSGYRYLYRDDFISGYVSDSKFGRSSYISNMEFNQIDYSPVVFQKGKDIDSLVDNIEVYDDGSIELTESGGQVVAAYDSDYNYKVLRIHALTRIVVEPNTDTSMIADYCGASCLIGDEPYDGDTYNYVPCVFVDGNISRKGTLKLGDWDGTGTLEFITLQECCLCLNVYYESEDQDLSASDPIFTINSDYYINNGDYYGDVISSYVDRAELLRNALDVAACGTVRLASSIPTGGMLPNVLYNLGTLSSNTNFLMASSNDNLVSQMWMWSFETGSTVPQLTFPSVTWCDNANTETVGNVVVPVVEANKHYEVTISNGYGTILSSDVAS